MVAVCYDYFAVKHLNKKLLLDLKKMVLQKNCIN